MSDEDRPTDDGWRTPRWSNRDLNVLKLRHQDEIAKLDGMISQIGEAMGLPPGANFAACAQRAKELFLEREPTSFGSDLSGGSTGIDVDAEIEAIDQLESLARREAR